MINGGMALSITRYTVFREASYDILSGHSQYSSVKFFNGGQERQAIEFINSKENIKKYGTLYLERRDADGCHDYNNYTKQWE